MPETDSFDSDRSGQDSFFAARDAADRYEENRNVSQAPTGGYSMPASVRRDKVWARVASAARECGASVRDWIDAQFDHCPGPAPYVRALASDTARRNYLEWSKSRATPGGLACNRFESELARGRALAAAVGLSGLDEFLLDPASGFTAYARCMICSESVLESVMGAFGSDLLREIEQAPDLASNIPPSLHERFSTITGPRFGSHPA